MKNAFPYFLGWMIIALVSCAPNIRTAGPSPAREPAGEASRISAAEPNWSWKTIRGEVRTIEQTRNSLRMIMEEYGVAGLSIALKQGEYWFRKQIKTNLLDLGVEDSKTGKPIDALTVFRADRLGQPVMAYIVMRLVSSGQIDLDMPLEKYLSKSLSDNPFYQDLRGDSRTRRLTARLILSHQSGLVNSRLTQPDRKLVFEASPGDGFRYSAEGYRLLQFVLEEKFGRSLNDLAKSVVFGPLGMSQSSFVREPRFEGHYATAVGVESNSEIQASDMIETFITDASDYTKFTWAVRMFGQDMSHEAFMSYIILPSVSVRSPSILEPPSRGSRPILPKRLSWCLGWGTYEIPRVILNICSFMGQSHHGIESYAMAFESERPTALTILVAGKGQRSATARILREILGEIETPLTWLGFENEKKRSSS